MLLGQTESTHISAVTQHNDWATPMHSGRQLQKMEIESDLEARLLKFEFESSFGSDLDSSLDYKFNAFPKHLNPGFDLQIMLKVRLGKICIKSRK